MTVETGLAEALEVGLSAAGFLAVVPRCLGMVAGASGNGCGGSRDGFRASLMAGGS